MESIWHCQYSFNNVDHFTGHLQGMFGKIIMTVVIIILLKQ